MFWRSAMSGGRATVGAAKGKRMAAQAGDISGVQMGGITFVEEFYIECKNYRDLNFGGLITGKGKLIEFWQETRRQAKHYGKIPMLIAKQNQYPIIVCLDGRGTTKLGVVTHLFVPTLGLRMVMWDKFLKEAKP